MAAPLPPIEDQLRRCILPLMAVTAEARWVGVGTAFVVSVVDEGRTALMFTAVHNLVGATKLDPYIQQRAHASTPSEFLQAAPPQLGSTKMYLLTRNNTPVRMEKAWWRSDSDVAMLTATLDAESEDRFDTRLPIDTRPQVPDDAQVIAIGFPRLEGAFSEPPDYEAERFLVRVETRFEARAGKVVRTVQPGDQGTHTGIGVHITSAIDSGMSGGPVVEKRDNCIIARAVASRDLSTDTHAGSGSGDYAFAGLFLPALAIKTNDLTAVTAAHGEMKDPTVLDLIRAGVIEDLGRADEWVRLVD